MLDIGTLTGRIVLEDGFTSVVMLAQKSLTGMGDSVGKATLAFAGLGASALAAGAAIVKLGDRGATVADIAEQFTFLAAKAGVDSVKALDNLREGTANTISDFNLMQSSLTMLRMGFAGTAEDMGIVAKSARILAEGGMDLEQALGMVSRALTTGQTRLLARLGINIDLSKTTDALRLAAEREGRTVDDVTLKHAKSAAILQALREYVNNNIKVTDDFTDKLNQAKTAIANFNDDLAKSVSASPALNDAFDRIKTAFANAFGGDREELINRYTAAIGFVATKVGDLGVAVINMGAVVANALKKVLGWWDTLPTPIKEVATTVGSTTVIVLALSTALGSLVRVGTMAMGMFTSLTSPVVGLARSGFGLLVTLIANVNAGFILLNNTVPVLTARIVIMEVSERALAAAKIWLATATATTTAALTAFGTRLAALPVISTAVAVAHNILAAAKMRLAALALAASINFTIFAGSATAAGLASKVTAFSVTALGAALLAVQYVLLPVAAAWAAWKFGEWLGSFPSVQRAMIWLAEHLHILSPAAAQARRDMLGLGVTTSTEAATAANGFEKVTPAMLAFQTRMTAIGKAAGKTGEELTQFVNDAIRKSGELKDNGATAVAALTEQYKLLSTSDTPALRKLAEEAVALQTAGATLSPELTGLVLRFKEAGNAGAGAADDLKKLYDAMDNLSGQKAILEATDLSKAYVKLKADGIKPSTDALLSFRDTLRTALETYSRMPGKTIAGVVVPTDAAQKTQDLYKEISELAKQAEIAKTSMESLAEGTRTWITASATAAQKTRDLSASLTFDEAAVGSATDMSWALLDVIAKQGDLSKMTKEQVDPALKAMTAGIKALEAAGKAVPSTWRDLQRELSSMSTGFRMAGASITTFMPRIKEMRDSAGNLVTPIYSMVDGVDTLVGAINPATGAFLDVNEVMAESYEEISKVSKAMNVLSTVFANINSKMGQAAQAVSAAWKIISNQDVQYNPKTGKNEPVVSGSEKWVAGLSAASEVVNTFVTGTGRAASATRGMFATMASGAAIGTMIMPGIGTAIGAVGGAIAGLVSGWNAAGKAAREANRQADAELTKLRSSLITAYGSLSNIDTMGKLIGVDLRGAWGDTTTAGLEHFKGLLDEFNKKLETLNNALGKYGLTWKDLGEEMKKFEFGKQTDALLEEFNLMVGSGANVQKVIKGMSSALSQYIIDSIEAGTKIPPAMQPILKQMIELGLITDEAARKMLGLSDSAMPSLAEIKDAADRYGLSLDALGPKVAQLSINEQATQIAKDWKILTAAGADINVILSSMNPNVQGMGEKVQELVNQAMKYGLELPSSMKPILQSMIDAGKLTDDTGKKLTDLSGLTFAADLTKMFDELMTKLDELIDKISVGVGGALTNVGDTQVPTVQIPYKLVPSDEGEVDASTMAGGGLVYAASGWKPRGSDTVPAMLTPGERVLTVAENAVYERGGRGGGVAVINIDGRRFAEVLVPHLPNVVQEYSLG